MANQREVGLKIEVDGEKEYKQAISVADRLCLTEVNDVPAEADAFFPPYDDWVEEWKEENGTDEKHRYEYAFVNYIRK